MPIHLLQNSQKCCFYPNISSDRGVINNAFYKKIIPQYTKHMDILWTSLNLCRKKNLFLVNLKVNIIETAWVFLYIVQIFLLRKLNVINSNRFPHWTITIKDILCNPTFLLYFLPNINFFKSDFPNSFGSLLLFGLKAIGSRK